MVFTYLFIYLFGTVCIYTVYDQQLFPVYFVELFPTEEEGNRIYGILNSAQVFVEALFLFLAPFIVNKVDFDVRLSATVYLIGFKVSSEIGVIVFSSIVGRLNDVTSYEATFYILGAIVVIFVIFSIFTLKNNDREQKFRP
ncbi:MFS transporter [Gracilibacillus alcaliphilus]|uniref:MFS transporter n=1 Tax=Gracilibacillus alcaliphilus TaxID=1401441 RepID=UPI00195A7C8D|nr:MFS transporter [Gracilibacillus alcaliphilus]MBM7677821.1 hypothetical protein [Gracilibacillus alcaliphilus]